MSTYRKIHGRSIQAVTTDPTGDVTEGQIWYNTDSDTFKTVLLSTAWASGSNTNITRGSGYGFGTLTAGVTGTGEQGPPGLAPAATEEYNGSGWATGNNYPRTDYFISACGTQTAGLAAGGFGPPKSNAANQYNGTSWTAAAANMNVAKFSGGMFGVQTSAIYCGGDGPVPGYVATTELYNGSSWSEVADLPVAKRQFATAGTSTAGLASGGRIGPGPTVATVDQWDGSSWTAAPSLNTARRYLQGWGLQTAALVCGGSPNGSTASALTEMYDGTSWSETADLATARHFGGTSQNQGVNTSGWMANGNAGPTFYTSTEEFDSSANVITAGAWANGDNMNTGSYNPAALVGGTQTAVIAAGGDTGGPAYSTTKSEEYDGSSWTATPTLNTARAAGTGTGTSTASIVFGAYPPSNAPATESWNGSSWTTTPATVGAPMERAGGSGTQTAALAFAYYNRPGNSNPTTVYSYNGSAWTTSPATMNSGRYGASGVGTQTAALAMGGVTVSPPAQSAAVEQWDGSSWTSKSSLTTARGYGGASGISTSAIFFGGNPPSPTTATEGWDGTSWSTRPSMATTRAGMGSSGTSADSGISYGGGSQLTATEEFTGESSALNVKTLTQS